MNKIEIGIDNYCSQELLKIADIQYYERGRYYHNYDHIKAMAGYFSEYFIPYDGNKLRVIIPAIVAHDIIYTGKDDEVDQSAEVFEFTMKHFLSEEEINFGKDLIMATKNHWTNDLNSFFCKIIKNVDIWELGSHPIIFNQNSDNLDRECASLFSNFHALDYEKKRINFLEHVLDKETIFFFDDRFPERTSKILWEKEFQARTNIANELRKLKEGD